MRHASPLPARLLALATITTLVGGSLAGCESAEQSFRKHKLRPLRAQLANDKARIAATLRVVPAHNDKAAAPLRAQIEQLAATVTKIGHLKAPKRAKGALRDYVAANTSLVDALRGFVAALVHGKKATLDRAGQITREAAGASQRADDALQAALVHR